MEYSIFVFESTYHTMKAERTLKGAKIACKVVTKPRHISSECGLAVRVLTGDQGPAETALSQASVAKLGCWPLE
jgi:hypothetical protein